jgi:hypothetical protein
MAEVDFEAWREKGQRVGRQLVQALDVMALEEAIRTTSTGLERARHRDANYAYRLGLQDVLREHRQAPKRGAH